MKNIGLDCRMIEHTGIGRYIAEILRYLSGSAKGENIIAFAKVGLNMNADLKQVVLDADVFSLKEQLVLPRLIAKERINLFHSPQFNIPICSRVKQITTIHDCAFDTMPEEAPSLIAKMYYKFMMKWVARKSVRIITVSESTKNDLMRFYRAPSRKIRVICRGVDIQKFRDFSDESIIKQTLKRYNLGAKYGLYVGLTRPRKNIMNILHAIQELKAQKNKDFKFVFAGKIDTRFYDIKALSKELGIGDIVVQTGFIGEEELLALYKKATFLTLPSIYEGFGLPVLEAMAAGTPVITSNISSLPEVAGDAAILVNPYNVGEIANAMDRVLRNPDLRRELVERGIERVKKFSWERCAKETLEVYGEVLNE